MKDQKKLQAKLRRRPKGGFEAATSRERYEKAPRAPKKRARSGVDKGKVQEGASFAAFSNSLANLEFEWFPVLGVGAVGKKAKRR